MDNTNMSSQTERGNWPAGKLSRTRVGAKYHSHCCGKTLFAIIHYSQLWYMFVLLQRLPYARCLKRPLSYDHLVQREEQSRTLEARMSDRKGNVKSRCETTCGNNAEGNMKLEDCKSSRPEEDRSLKHNEETLNGYLGTLKENIKWANARESVAMSASRRDEDKRECKSGAKAEHLMDLLRFHGGLGGGGVTSRRGGGWAILLDSARSRRGIGRSVPSWLLSSWTGVSPVWCAIARVVSVVRLSGSRATSSIGG
jgi:hypothetical protein